MTSPLHLPSLSARAFRGIRSLDLPQLGRVTLLAGENGIGKTSVLDAIRSYASRGDFRVLVELLHRREELITGYDDDGEPVLFPDFASLFHEYDPYDDNSPPSIRIASKPARHNLSLNLVDPKEDSESQHLFLPETAAKDLKVSVGKAQSQTCDWFAALRPSVRKIWSPISDATTPRLLARTHPA